MLQMESFQDLSCLMINPIYIQSSLRLFRELHILLVLSLQHLKYLIHNSPSLEQNIYILHKLPIIGMGGIMNADDAIEFILAGASAVAVGTANFHNPYATEEIVKGIDAYMEKYGIEDIHELIGAVR